MLHFFTATEHIWRDLVIITLLGGSAFIVLTIREFLERNNVEIKSESLSCSSFTTTTKSFTQENNCEINRKLITIERNRLFDRNEIELLREKLAEFKFP
ncbi:hypothetical protein ABK040_002775 [Willaertia magna]